MSQFSHHSFMRGGETFFETLALELIRLGFRAQDLKPDHLCFRVETIEQYESYKVSLSTLGNLLTEAPVNGRPIATYRLHQPFGTRCGPISIVELPSPKPSSPYRLGFEHAEFVILESFDELRAKHPNCEFSAVGGTPINFEMGLKTPAGNAKFHHQTLECVIEIETLRDLP